MNEAHRPPPSNDRRATLYVAGAALLLLSLGIPFGIPFSAGVAGALRILDGGAPCRDFWTLYAPGHFFLLAGAFALIAKQLWVAALLAVALEAAACALLFRLLRRLAIAPWIAGGAALCFAGARFRAAPTLTTYEPLLVCGLAAIGRVIEVVRRPARRTALAAGAWLGAAAWFKHDVAAYLSIAAVAALAAASIGAGGRASELRRAALHLGLGAVLAAAPVALALAASAGADAWRDLIVFPLTEFRRSRPESYPDLRAAWSAAGGALATARALLEWVRHWAPAGAWLAVASVVAAGWRSAASERRAAGVFALSALPLFFLAAHAQINTHVFSMSAIVLAALAAGWSGWLALPARNRCATLLLAAVTALELLALANDPARHAARALDLLQRGRTIAAPGAAGILVAPDEAVALEALARRVGELTAPGEPIFVGVARHDAVVTSKPQLYLLLDRPNATRYAELHPAIVDREEIQREILADLRAKDVRRIVLWHVGWSDERFDEIRRRRMELLPGTGSTLLDEALRRDFEPAGRFGEFELRLRR